MNNEAGKPFLTRKEAAAWAVAAVGLYIVLLSLGADAARAAPVGWFVLTIALAIRVYWTLRQHWWFWMAVMVLVVVHASLVVLVPWPAMHFSGQGFLPYAFLDAFANCGVFALSARIMKVSTSD